MANIFINAAKARENTRNNTVVHSEVRALENEVLVSIEAGELSVTVTSGTGMTDNTEYYKAYYSIIDDRAMVDQIDYVSKYFRDLGYGIRLGVNHATGNTLAWTISW